MRLVTFGFWIILLVLGIVFAVLNADKVSLNYYFGTAQVELSLIMVLAIVAGALLGVLSSLGVVLKAKREAAKYKKAADIAEKEVLNLRAIPIQDKH